MYKLMNELYFGYQKVQAHKIHSEVVFRQTFEMHVIYYRKNGLLLLLLFLLFSRWCITIFSLKLSHLELVDGLAIR